MRYVPIFRTKTIRCASLRFASSVASVETKNDAWRDVSSRRRRLRFDLESGPSLRQSIAKVQEREKDMERQRRIEMLQATENIEPFGARVARHVDTAVLQRRQAATTMQINIGKFCNLTCRHCHVESGPSKRLENMSSATVDRCIDILAASPAIDTVDITGGAPELNPHFRRLVQAVRRMGKRVTDRCNLVVMFERGQEDLAQFLAENQVHVVASLPCYTSTNTDRQRGQSVHMDSVHALQALNKQGYGRNHTLQLDLVYNPLGATLPPSQNALEADYRLHLEQEWGIVFDKLFAITNMPIKRFADDLWKSGQYEVYMNVLSNAFNASTIDNLMCRDTVNIQWDGSLFDCDFNAALHLNMKSFRDIWSLDSLSELGSQPIVTSKHCYGCTAGPGSSCSGALMT